ncbi:hypothetical protein RI129_009500 [Pyrocoelia pectoralis]|uniref:RNB domain-containing protein n=1 Tax=Pyrocoelia pectoralis TaxID=417401 RepID=A0AAN7V8I1_9COLE
MEFNNLLSTTSTANSLWQDLMCTSNSALSPNAKKKKKKKKQKPNMPKVQDLNNISPDVDDLLEYFTNFKITAIYSQNTGKVCRIKKFGCKHTHASLNVYYANNAVLNSGGSSLNSSRNPSLQSRDNSLPPRKIENGMVSIKSSTSLPHTPRLQSNAVTKGSNSKNAKKRISKKAKMYQPYLTKREVDDGLNKGSLIQGVIRINQKNRIEAYVTNREQSNNDYLLKSVADRNRALEGDIVVIRLRPESEWLPKYKTAVVVYIMEKVHSRIAIGQLTTRDGVIILIPRDTRLPKIKIQQNCCPIAAVNKTNALIATKIVCWPDIDYAEGVVIDILGLSGDLNSENRAILAEYGIDVTPHLSNPVNCDTGQLSDYEQKNRTHFRNECIFTIDPLTARDLDDAVSCTELPNGNFHIGVHISDVSFYLEENSELDLCVRRKATSVYMVNDVLHMLPIELCAKCSLLPGVDKRAFSVLWEITKDGDIIQEYFTRSLINSCAQLAYEHAQLMIDNPNRVFQEHELPPIYGGYTYKDLSHKINLLHQIALNLRRRRFENGALRIDQTKLSFKLDEESGEPVDFYTYESKEANRLIEEFMLLANISVARRIETHFPNLAFLRRHDPPKESMLQELEKRLALYNIPIDTSSSKALQASVINIGNTLGLPHMAVVNHFMTKPMNRARYFCAQGIGNYSHYALSVPIYTHFTSPIRRYADIMVHRLLAASLGIV